jgi:uncharacterized protein YjbI with pentapeptide repeats
MKNRIQSVQGKTLFAAAGLEDLRQVLEAAVALGVDLQASQFQSAHLSGANIRSGKFRDASFDGANLCGADLSFADVRGASFKRALFDCMTRFQGLKFEGGELEGMLFVRLTAASKSQTAIQYL